MNGAIAQDRESCQFLFYLRKTHRCTGRLGRRGGREGRERFFMERLPRTQSERRRRLALASGFRLAGRWNRSNRALARAVGRG